MKKNRWLKTKSWTILDYDKREIRMWKGHRDNSVRREPHTVNWIETFEKEDIFYDVGANVGAYTLIAASRGCKVFSFEPHLSNFNVLLKNIVINNFTEVATPINIPLYHIDGFVDFQYTSIGVGTSSHTIGIPQNTCGRLYDPALTLTVPTIRIDSLVKNDHFKKPTHVKIDVDGCEYEVLKGGIDTIKDCSSILVEVQKNKDRNWKEIEDIMAKLGFKISKSETWKRNKVYRK